MRVRNKQAGIAIGPILFVVAMLGILAAAIAAGSGSFNSNTSTMSASACASAIIQYGEQLKVAVDRMRLSQEIPDTQISFRFNRPAQNGVVVNNSYNNTSCTSDACRVFVTGGIRPGDFFQCENTAPLSGLWQTDLTTVSACGGNQTCLRMNSRMGRVGTMSFPVIDVENIGTNDNDLLLQISGLRNDVGAQIMNRINQNGFPETHLTPQYYSGQWQGSVDESWFTMVSE